MRALNAWIDHQNRWSHVFRGQTVVYEITTAQGRKRVAQAIDSALSPELLTCDGELSRTEVNRRYRALTAAARDLLKLDPSLAQYMYEFG
jgi:hypothetical protein